MRFPKRSVGICLIACTVAFAAAPASAGGKGGAKTSGGTLKLVLLESSDGVAHYGDDITFEVSTTATDHPTVAASCYQAGQEVYAHTAGFYPDYPWPELRTYTLSSSVWVGGAAECVATMFYSRSNGRVITLATLGFSAAA